MGKKTNQHNGNFNGKGGEEPRPERKGLNTIKKGGGKEG